jgi:hypothetical protein
MGHYLIEPQTPTEFEVKAYLFARLRELGFNVRGEVRSTSKPGPTENLLGGELCADLAIFDGGKLLLVIEVKAQPTDVDWYASQQGRRYDGAPIMLVGGMDEARRFTKSCEENTGLISG